MRGLTRTLLLSLAAASAIACRRRSTAAAGASRPRLPRRHRRRPRRPLRLPTPAADIQDFVPTEKVSADDAVAFPTDI